MTTDIFTRTTNDISGNPRYIVHFFELLTDEEQCSSALSIMEKKMIAIKRAKSIGGKAYKGKDYGGGIVFQSYNLNETLKEVVNLTKQ